MIREKALKCKLLLLGKSDLDIFSDYMASFSPERETCPFCGARGQCVVHAYYGRQLIGCCHGNPVKFDIVITRVICNSCGHTHAILPDHIIPYETHSLLFILTVLGEYFAKSKPVSILCRNFGIDEKQLYRWLQMWTTHRQLWLGLLEAQETTDLSFLDWLRAIPVFSTFTASFTMRFSISFLQSHKNPTNYCQRVFT